MERGGWRSAGQGEAMVDPGAVDWRSQLPRDARQQIVNKIIETLKRHLSVSGPEGFAEVEKIAVRFEEKIYAAATNQSDYQRKVSLKMLSMETKTQNAAAVNPSSSNLVGSQSTADSDMPKKTVTPKRRRTGAGLQHFIDMRRNETDRYISAIRMNQVEEKKCTIGECVTAFNQVCDLFPIEDIVKATTFFKDADNREIFLHLKEERRVEWLQVMLSKMD